MPIGFAKSILAQGTTATGANAFLDYDGSNDQTFTRNAAVQGFLGFAAFNDEYGVSMHITDAGGASNDLIRYDVLRNNSGTLEMSSQEQSWVTTTTNNYTDFIAKVVPTNSGNIFVYADALSNNTGGTFSISGATVTKHNTFGVDGNFAKGNGGRMYRRPGSDVYVNMLSRGGQVVTLTDNGNSSSTSSGAGSNVANSDMFYNNARGVNGFKDANTVLMWKTIEDSPSTNINTIVPFELDLTTTGNNISATAISGVTGAVLNLNSSVSNAIDFGAQGSSHFETTDFNDTLLFWERVGGTPGGLRVHHYTPGDSSVTSSNAINFSTLADNDVSPTGCFVGSNNDVFLFAMLCDPSNLRIMKFVKSTNTLSTITTITETFNVEKCRMSRWGDGAALLTYNDVKMRLIKP